jgi:hypothetical protein
LADGASTVRVGRALRATKAPTWPFVARFRRRKAA